MDTSDAVFDGAVRLLPTKLAEEFGSISPTDRRRTEELRLRAGFRPSVLLGGGERAVGAKTVTARDLDAVVEIATSASAHAVRETVRAGFISAAGGYRIGLCGTVIREGGGICGFGALGSIAIRLPREVGGIADELAAECNFGSTLIVSPPGAGKTTLLRELVRLLSDGSERLGVAARRVALADERGELAAVQNGAATMYVGRQTDVMSLCPKTEAILMLLRAMNPEIIAVDEITAASDVDAIFRAAGCGVDLLATVHAASVTELMTKPQYGAMLGGRVFDRAIVISREGAARRYEVVRLHD